MGEAQIIHREQSLEALSKREEKRGVELEESLEQLSYWLEDIIRVPVLGWRFGLDALIGFIPGLGDTATTIVSFYILVAAVRYRVPKITIMRMALNIAIDYLLGVIPFLGDAFDFAWKSNKMNMNLLRMRATVSSAAQAKNTSAVDWLFVVGVMLILLLILSGSLFLSFLLLQSVWQLVSQVIY